MVDGPVHSDRNGINPSGQGPAQPQGGEGTEKTRGKKPSGAASAKPEGQADVDEDTHDLSRPRPTAKVPQ